MAPETSTPTSEPAPIATVNELPVDAWKPYLKASLLNGFAPYMSKSLVDAEFGFYTTTLRGVKEQQPRWKRGVNILNGNLGEMLGKLYVERHFKPEAKARMKQLVNNLIVALREDIPTLSTGDSVRHGTLGEGVVIQIEAGGVVTVRFADGSERRLMLDYAPLERIA